MQGFEITDHTSDVGIVAYGKSLEEVFVNAALGTFSLVADLGAVAETIERSIEVDAMNREELLVAWLNELLYLFDAERLIFRRFQITGLEEEKLSATAWGEEIDPSRHNLQTQVKAATYHQLKLEKPNGFRAQVILDV